MGDLLLDRIFSSQENKRSVPDNLGVLLTSENMNEHLENIREDREHYRYTHPDDIAEIAQQFDLYLRSAGAAKG